MSFRKLNMFLYEYDKKFLDKLSKPNQYDKKVEYKMNKAPGEFYAKLNKVIS